MAISNSVVTATKATSKPVRMRRNKITAHQVVTFLRRIAIIAVAVVYVVSSVRSTIASYRVLRGIRNEPMAFEDKTSNIVKYMGSGTVTESPLVVELLKNDTSPRNYTLYIEADSVSPTGCKAPLFNNVSYSNFFLRLGHGSLVRDTHWNLTELTAFQLIQPIVDCSFAPINTGNPTLSRIFYLLRHRVIPNYVALFSARFSMQNYRIPDRSEEGPIGLISYAMITDMRHQSVEIKLAGAVGYPFELATYYPYVSLGQDDQGWWKLRSVSPNPLTTPTLDVITSRRTGFYVNSDSEQSNIKNSHWNVPVDPMSALASWSWRGEPVLKDSWAWVHFIHGYFALDGIFNLLVLFLVIYRNLQKGKIWIGDAFVSISSTLLLRGFVILVSWVINAFWALMEMCLHDAHYLAGTQDIFFHPEIMHADLMTIHLAVSTIFGYVFKERIDPTIAIVAFEIGFAIRLDIATKWFPSVLEYIKAYAETAHLAAIVSVSESVSVYSPMRMWTSHPLPAKNIRLIFSCLLPVLSTGVLILVWVALRKFYRKLRPSKLRVIRDSNTTGQSEDERSLLTYKRNLTIFEIATGAELQSRFGVISDFENYLIIKGMKYASADGIYSNGFLIVNGKVIIATADLLTVIMMKVLRVRFRNVYTYEIDGTTVQRTARLVYPHTFTWSDLVNLNLTVLS